MTKRKTTKRKVARKRRSRRKTMRITIFGKNVTMTGKYAVHYGTTDTAFNRNSKQFRSRERAVAFKNRLVRKYKDRYNIRTQYIAH